MFEAIPASGMNRTPFVEIGLEEMTMQPSILQYLFLAPVGLGLAFMLWVLWNLTKQLSQRNGSTEKQPMISIRVGERYSGDRQLQRNTRLGFEPQSRGISESRARPGHSALREDFQTPGAPTLGMGLRWRPSSTIRGAHR